MEIIMKVKCSPSPGAGSSPHSTLKIVDHHHQLQQHTYTNAGYKSSPPPPSPHNVMPPRTYTPNTPHPGNKYAISGANSGSSCNDCSLGYCCNVSPCCATTPSPSHYSQTPPLALQRASPSSATTPVQYTSTESYTSNAPCQAADEPEFVSIDDEKVKQYLIRLGQQQLQKQRQQQQQQQQQQSRPQKEPKITHVFSAPTNANAVKPVVYEIIELDDEDEREKLKQIKQQAEQSLANRKLPPNLTINLANRNTKSLDISLIPKTSDNKITTQNSQELPLISSQTSSSRSSINKNSANHKIIAEIDLLESDDEDDAYVHDDNNDEDDDDDDDTLPLVAVSCELQCDDEDEEDIVQVNTAGCNVPYNSEYLNVQQNRSTVKYSKPLVDDVVIVGSHADKNNDDNMLVRWEEYEGQRERVFFECFLCGKKVQSSYNLRRHMMIHTGERPFGCDLCDRRFREFSDMKKHRRRHANEPSYLCMVCHERPPVDNDPTRCINCCTQSKNAVIMAAMKPATDADNAAEQNTRLKSATVTETLQSSKPSLSSSSSVTHSVPQKQLHTLPTITSVTSYNIAAIRTKSPNNSSATAAANTSSGNTKSTEDTQRLLDNIPAVHRPGYNELGMITRKEFPCPLCNRAFGTRHNLKRHYMIHTGEKPFSCSKCRKPFREYSTLKKHMVTHIRERWYKCMRCPMKFRDFLKYTEHKETHRNDSDSDEQQHLATSSSKSTKYSSAMQVDGYMDSNDDDSGAEDWLECCECNQRFNEIDAYNEHLKEHDVNTQIFQCYICKEQLKTRAELDQHIARQHKLDTTDSMDEDNGEA
ncbi:zinc finger protein 12 [Lucilia cuprina]|uniref:zinc finger protein 12 n=1 Tax=Lucilia cuprina TaxID=7375 RepID=UPI001F0661EC|nr:zinc finger protein 12 [Lucilia cuprina]XP_046807229.1 zinc finger protein 12 [Lucilia cuprina]XP_046807235.1 zinc finger protein 12 [Lucilia cuprina]XP_046807237.1 zinc finger protein 12 [Lucilia cuprina]